jgi:hypothetical protein
MKAKNAGKDELMKLSVVAFIALGVAACLCTTPASAQVSMMRMEIPFGFLAGDHTLPAGTYRVTVDQDFRRVRFDNVDDMNVWLVRMSTATEGRPAKATAPGTLRFARYDGQYFLISVWRPGERDGNRVGTSKRLLEAATHGNPSPVTVTVATP